MVRQPPVAIQDTVHVAALFVARGGCYWDIEDCDPWDEERDARLYAGPHPVVAHPPCARWCQLASLVESLHPRFKKGEDGGMFASALASVRQWGGVLEHPAYSHAWKAYDLLPPTRGCWSRSLMDQGWVTEVSQAAYGHRARKLTWLYYVGKEPLTLDWSVPAWAARLSWFDNHHAAKVKVVGAAERAATPIAFRDLLLSLARSARP